MASHFQVRGCLVVLAAALITAGVVVPVTASAAPAKLAISTTTLPTVVDGVGYSQTLAGSGGTGPYTWSVTTGALPPGLVLTPSTGRIAGTPVGVYAKAFTVTVRDASTPVQSVKKSFTIRVTAPVIATTALPKAAVGVAYSQAVTLTGGVGPFSWTTKSALPAGLSLSATGTISGTPTVAGSKSVSLTVTDSSTPAEKISKSLTVAVVSMAVDAPSPIPVEVVGQAYSAQFTVAGGHGPYAWSGTLPKGLTLNTSTGLVAGTPTTAATTSTTLKVVDSSAKKLTATLAVKFTAVAVAITPTSLPAAAEGQPYAQQLTAIGGVAPYTWKITKGSLPAGISLDPSTGSISGTPITAGGATLTVQVADSTAKKALTATASYAVTVAVPAVTGLGETASTTTSLSLAWIPPSGSGAALTVICRESNGLVDSTPTGCIQAGSVGAATDSMTDSGLSPDTAYTYSVFSEDASGTASAGESITLTTSTPLTVTTSSLVDGIAGATYSVPLQASGGTEPYTWTVSGLPDGLSASSDGLITGFPATTGTSTVVATVTDAQNTTVSATLVLAVPTALPSQCQDQTCAVVTPDGATVQVPAADIVSVSRDPSTGQVTSVVLSGITPAVNDILVLATTGDLPSGLIARANSVTDNADGTITVAVTPGTIADAYADGTVQALGTTQTGTDTSIESIRATPADTAKPAATRAAEPEDEPGLSCTGGVTATLAGLGVTHSFTPTLTAIWKHPLFSLGGFYPGLGGLNFFYADVQGSITLNMGVSISGSATCTLTLPGVNVAFPAGDLGEINLDVDPSITFSVTGRFTAQESVTLSCDAYYMLDDGTSNSLQFCTHQHTPFELSADTGIDATLSAQLDASLLLDDTAGITGNITGTLHAGYHPAQQPVTELDVKVTGDLKGVLANWWKGAPTIDFVSGDILPDTILYRSSTAPPDVPLQITTTSLDDGVVGQLYAATLSTADGRAGTWAVSSGSLPPGLALSSAVITGTPTATGTYRFSLTFTDGQGDHAAVDLAVTIEPSCDANDTCTPNFSSITAPMPANENGRDVPDLVDVSCGSPGSCVAAGEYFDSADILQGFADTLSNGSWSSTELPLPANASTNAQQQVWIRQVSCASGTSSCVAVGTYVDNNGVTQGLIERTAGTGWSAIEAVTPSGLDAVNSALSSVSCAAATTCVAVGRWSDGGQGYVLIDSLASGNWSGISPALPADAMPSGQSSLLTAVDCPSTSRCTGVGYYRNSQQHLVGLAETLTGGSWGSAAVPLPSDAAANPGAELSDLSCPTTTFCGAFGVYLNASGAYVMLSVEQSGSWVTVSAPLPAATWSVPGPQLNDISCTTDATCAVVGYYLNTHDIEAPLIDRFSGGSWSAQAAPLPSGALTGDDTGLASVSCTSPTLCTAVGSYGTGDPQFQYGKETPLQESLVGSTWSAGPAPIPSGAGDVSASLTTVTCATANSCTSLGWYSTSSGDPVPIIDS